MAREGWFYEPDGICLAFNRGLPLVIREEPVIEAYRRRYGREPRLPEEIDTQTGSDGRDIMSLPGSFE